MASTSGNSTVTVLILFFILVLLLIVLFYLYKRLNHETKDQYTIQHLVFNEGGLRDRVMQGIALVEARLDNMRSRTHDEEQALSIDEDGGIDKEEGEDNAGQGHSENEKTDKKAEEDHNDSSDDYSSIDLKERVMLNNSKEEKNKEKEQEEEKVAKDGANGDGSKPVEDDVKNEERVGLLVDLKTFSGSAIWSEEKKEASNVTAL
ncbi:cilia- and flagella-associated protein 251 [Tachysurus ichikawai]